MVCQSFWTAAVVAAASAHGWDLISSDAGAVATWEGVPKQERQQRQAGYSAGPAVGFFIGGSTIEAMNGLYYPIHPTVLQTPWRAFQMAYRHKGSQWILALTQPYEHDHSYVRGWTRYVFDFLGGESSEWLLIDDAGRDRFGCLGDDIVPGYGRAWGHLHRASDDESQLASNKDIMDDEQELPWQVVGVMSAARWRDLQQRSEQYDWHVQEAVEHLARPQPTLLLSDASLDGNEVDVIDSVRWTSSTELHCESIMPIPFGDFPSASHAEAHVKMASCLRRMRDFEQALRELDKAQQITSEMALAQFERALVLLDSSRHAAAITALEKLLRWDRSWPRLSWWLLRAHVLHLRVERAATASPNTPTSLRLNPDHHAVLEIPVDCSEDEIRRAYRHLSRTFHPDRPGGRPETFVRLAEAQETLLDKSLAQAYQEGWDLQQSGDARTLRERTERRYFPERFPFEPFGDPLEEFPDVAAARRQRAARQEL